MQALIRIPSVNPEVDPLEAPGGEEKVALFVRDYLQGCGFGVTLEKVLPGRPNVLARAPGPVHRPRILLCPHLDTVSVRGMTIDPYAGTVSEGKILGRGASDTKGSMAAMMWALRENADILADLPVAVDFAGFVGEETGQPGSIHFAHNHAGEYQFAIAGEPTGLAAVHVTKGCLWAAVRAAGRASHASKPELGENAILKLGRGLEKLVAGWEAAFSEFGHPVLGAPSLNVGMISGGSQPNIVPDSAVARLDMRTTPGAVAETTMARRFTDYVEKTAPELEVEMAREFLPMETAADHEWLGRLAKACPEMRLVGAPWFSDAAHLAAGGTPSICLGPGSIDQAHTKDEFISVADLEAGGRFFSRFIRSLAGY